MSINLTDAFVKLTSTNWSYINTFRCQFSFSSKFGNLVPPVDVSLKNKLESDSEVYLTKANIPSLTSSPTVNWINHQNFQTMSTLDVMQISIDFLDHDQMELYRFWSSYYLTQLDNYFDEYKFTVTFSKLPDNPGEEEFVVATFEDCMVISVSQVDFGNETSGSGTIAKLSVTIQSPKVTINTNIKNEMREFKNY